MSDKVNGAGMSPKQSKQVFQLFPNSLRTHFPSIPRITLPSTHLLIYSLSCFEQLAGEWPTSYRWSLSRKRQ